MPVPPTTLSQAAVSTQCPSWGGSSSGLEFSSGARRAGPALRSYRESRPVGSLEPVLGQPRQAESEKWASPKVFITPLIGTQR